MNLKKCTVFCVQLGVSAQEFLKGVRNSARDSNMGPLEYKAAVVHFFKIHFNIILHLYRALRTIFSCHFLHYAFYKYQNSRVFPVSNMLFVLYLHIQCRRAGEESLL
jgi:hypothetical protein